MKISPMGTELLHADGQTGVTKLIVGFHNFAKAPKTVEERGVGDARLRGVEETFTLLEFTVLERKEGRGTKREKKRNRKHMGDSSLRQFGTWKLEGFQHC